MMKVLAFTRFAWYDASMHFTPSFITVPVSAIRPDISWLDTMVFSVVQQSRIDGWSRLSNREIADVLGIKNDRSISLSVSVLVRCGMLKRVGEFYQDRALSPADDSAPAPVPRAMRGGKKRVPRAMWVAVMLRDKACVLCGEASVKLLQCDHIVPEVRGGVTLLENLRVLCRDCNLAKGQK